MLKAKIGANLGKEKEYFLTVIVSSASSIKESSYLMIEEIEFLFS